MNANPALVKYAFDSVSPDSAEVDELEYAAGTSHNAFRHCIRSFSDTVTVRLGQFQRGLGAIKDSKKRRSEEVF